jgi:hypothetical protein
MDKLQVSGYTKSAKPYEIKAFPDSAPLITSLPTTIEEPSRSFHQTQSMWKMKPAASPWLLFALDIAVALSCCLLISSEVLNYINLWGLPNKNGDFWYPTALIGSIQLLGLGSLAITGGCRIWNTETSLKPVWWSTFFGLLISFTPLTIVIFKEDIFVGTLMTGTFKLSGPYLAVYAMTAIGVGLLIPGLATLDMFGEEVMSAGYCRLMIVIGAFTKQISLIVTIHSIIVQVGFVLFIFGVLLVVVGLVLGLRERSKSDFSF